MQCDSSLRSVVLLQHDQIRDEVYAQEGVSLFIDCASASHYEVLIRQRALENLLIMSFNESVATAIKGNADFVATLKSLSENSAAVDLQRASESLLWMLTKDDSAATPKTASTTDTYDIMISYSHKDKDLCFQIYDRLQQDQFRVWLDRDQMYGTPLEAMSGAIEKSEFGPALHVRRLQAEWLLQNGGDLCLGTGSIDHSARDEVSVQTGRMAWHYCHGSNAD